MKGVWKLNYHIVPPNVHFCNAVKRSIHTLKAHFLGILSSITEDFAKKLWYILLPQTEINLDLL